MVCTLFSKIRPNFCRTIAISVFKIPKLPSRIFILVIRIQIFLYPRPSKKLHKPPDPSEANVTKLIGFLSLEERKGVDHFDARRFLMFKGLFRNYGDSFMHLFRPHLERLVEQDQESAHRCAAEIIAGMFMFFMLLCTLHYGRMSKNLSKFFSKNYEVFFILSTNWNMTQSY